MEIKDSFMILFVSIYVDTLFLIYLVKKRLKGKITSNEFWWLLEHKG